MVAQTGAEAVEVVRSGGNGSRFKEQNMWNLVVDGVWEVEKMLRITSRFLLKAMS